MAPNIALKDSWNDSGETSLEVIDDLPGQAVAGMPEVFLSHLPQHFQDPDGPNLHLLQRHGAQKAGAESGKTQGGGTTPRPSSGGEAGDGANDRNNRGLRRRTQGPEVTTEVLQESSSASPGSPRNKALPFRPRAAATSPSPPTSAPVTIDHGVLKLPGHEPEAPADLVLVHHDRAIDTRNQTGLNGIFVRDDSTVITPQGATALILVGICTVILVFICFILFVQKIRRDKIARKVSQDGDGLKPQPTEEATNANLHPNPLSLLPPALLHALANITLSAVNRTDENLAPSFLTMEPSQSVNSLGRLWFSVYYDYVQATLVLRILHARYTKGRGSCTKPGDVWIESCVMTPMNIIKACTKSDNRRASSAPVFNQTFKFKVADEEVTQFLLRMTMYDRHPQNGEKAVGSVIVPLSTVDLCSNKTISRDFQ